MDVRNLNQKLDDTNFELTEKLRKEEEDRNNKMRELQLTFEQAIESQRNFATDFKEKAIAEFNHVTVNVKKEVQHRLSEQDDVLDGLSNIVRTIQDTLKVLGKDA